MAQHDQTVRRAVDRLRALASRATAGPWQVDGPWWHIDPAAEVGRPASMVSAVDGRRPVLLSPPADGHDRSEIATVAYVAAVGPAVGYAVADLLETLQPWVGSPMVSTLPAAQQAVALALTVLGQEVDGG